MLTALRYTKRKNAEEWGKKGVIYEVTVEVKSTGIMASLGCDQCV